MDISFNTIEAMPTDEYTQFIDDIKYYSVSITLMSHDMRLSLGHLPRGSIKDIKSLFTPNGNMYITVHVDDVDMRDIIHKIEHMLM
jgi:hypothetical protein